MLREHLFLWIYQIVHFAEEPQEQGNGTGKCGVAEMKQTHRKYNMTHL